MARRARQVPQAPARDYYRALAQLIEEDNKRIWEAIREEVLPRIREYRRAMSRAEQSPQPALHSKLVVNAGEEFSGMGGYSMDQLDEIERILTRLENDSHNRTFREGLLKSLAEKFVTRISQVNRRQIIAQLEASGVVPGFDPSAEDPWLRAFIRTAVEENVSHIKSVVSDKHRQIRTIITQGVRRGTNINDLRAAISKATGASKQKAKFLARDQMGSIYGDLTKARQKRLGLRKFRWITSRDERVRDSHAVLDGEVFTWDKGARNERGEQIWPGTDYNCRCVAEPVREEIEE